MVYRTPPKRMEREILIQYTDLVKEQKEINARIAELEKDIDRLERKYANMPDVVEVVKGGYGGDERVQIRGYSQERQRFKTDLAIKKLLLSQRRALLTTLEFEILEKANDVSEYIASIDNSYMRRLISFRVIDGLKWEEVAAKMGGGNSEDTVKKAFYRFLK